MAGRNRVDLFGNLVANAEVRYTQTKTPVTSFRIACTERYYSGGETKERTEFINCVLWGKRGEALVRAECLNKGQSLSITGRLQTRSWKAQDETNRYITEVVVGNLDGDLQLLARRGSQVRQQPQNAPPPNDADAPTETKPSEPDDFSS